MPIGTLDGPVSVGSSAPDDIVRLENNHALAIMGQSANVIDITGDVIASGSAANYSSGASDPRAKLVDPDTYKVAVAFNQPSRYLLVALIDCDLATDSFTSDDVIVRDSFTENPSFFEMLWSGAICSQGDMVQVFWMERSGGVVGVDNFQLWCMTVDCSGSTPVAGTPVKYMDTTPISAGYGVPVLALLMGNGSGIILYTSNHISTFTFGNSPSTPTAGGSLNSSAYRGGVILPGNVGFAVDTSLKGAWCTPTSAALISSPSVTGRYVDALQSRTVLNASATQVGRTIINGTTIDSVDNVYTYCSSGCGSVSPLAVMGAFNDKALIVNDSGTAYLLGGIPTDDPFPFDTGHRLWMYKTTDGGRTWISRGITT